MTGGRKRKTEEETVLGYVPNLKQVHKKTSDASEDPPKEGKLQTEDEIDMREWTNIQDQQETDEELQEDGGKEQNFEEELISIVDKPSHQIPDNGKTPQNWKEGCTFKCNMCEVITLTRSDMRKHCIASGHGKGTVNCYTIHTKGTYVCLLCDKSIMKESMAISDHMHRVHNSSLKKYEKQFHSNAIHTAVNKNNGKSPRHIGKTRKSTENNIEDLVPVSKQAHEEHKEKYIPDMAHSISGRTLANQEQEKKVSVSNVDKPSPEKLEDESISQNWSEGCTFQCKMCEVTALSTADINKHCITSGHGRVNSHTILIKKTYVCQLCDKSLLHESNVISDHMRRVHKSTLKKYEQRFHSDGNQTGVGKKRDSVSNKTDGKSPNQTNPENKCDENQVEDLVPVTKQHTNDGEKKEDYILGTTHSIFGSMLVNEEKDKSLDSHSLNNLDNKLPKKWSEGCIFKCNMCNVTSTNRVGMRLHCSHSGHGKGTKDCYTIHIKSTYICILCAKPILWDPLSISYHLQQLHKIPLDKYEKRFHSDSTQTVKRKDSGTGQHSGKTPRLKLRRVEDLFPVMIGGNTTNNQGPNNEELVITSAFSIAKPGGGHTISCWSEGCEFKCNSCHVRTIRRTEMKRHCKDNGHGRGTVDCYKMTKKDTYSCRICKSSLWRESTVIRDHTIKQHGMSLAKYEKQFHSNGKAGLREEISNKISKIVHLKAGGSRVNKHKVECRQTRGGRKLSRATRAPNTPQNGQPLQTYSRPIGNIKKNYSNISITKVPPNQGKPEEKRNGDIVDEISKYPSIEISKVNSNGGEKFIDLRNKEDDDIQEIYVSQPQRERTSREQELEEEVGLLRLKLAAAEAQIKVFEAELKRRPKHRKIEGRL